MEKIADTIKCDYSCEIDGETYEARLDFQVRSRERDSSIDNLLVRIHFIIEMILVDRPRAMGV